MRMLIPHVHTIAGTRPHFFTSGLLLRDDIGLTVSFAEVLPPPEAPSLRRVGILQGRYT